MDSKQINELIEKGVFPGDDGRPELVETHISWVLLCNQFVYKIKKPIQYSFLDFSTLEKRKYYCERELELNKRLTENIYLDVITIRFSGGVYHMGGGEGTIIDYALNMRKVDRQLQMNYLLSNNQVTNDAMERLAEKIAGFHKNAIIIYRKDFLDVQNKFNDLAAEADFLTQQLGAASAALIEKAIRVSNHFLSNNSPLLARRLRSGFFRDCHGDLHSANIFLLATPQPFDCIEFNDDFRQIDVLNDVAFLCMDLDACNRKDLAGIFLNTYNNIFPAINNEADMRLFTYYKSYRANIRAKVNSLRARPEPGGEAKKHSLKEAGRYLQLMESYISILDG